MRPKNISLLDSYFINDSESVQKELKQVAGIMDAKYEPADIDQVVRSYSQLKENKKLDERDENEDSTHEFKIRTEPDSSIPSTDIDSNWRGIVMSWFMVLADDEIFRTIIPQAKKETDAREENEDSAQKFKI